MKVGDLVYFIAKEHKDYLELKDILFKIVRVDHGNVISKYILRSNKLEDAGFINVEEYQIELAQKRSPSCSTIIEGILTFELDPAEYRGDLYINDDLLEDVLIDYQDNRVRITIEKI